MTLGLMIDVLVAVLLAVTIFYAVVLNRRLGQLRTSRADFEKLVTEFSSAAVRTEKSIAALQESSGDRQADLQSEIDRAKALRDELAFMLDRGDGLAEKLGGLIRSGRQASQMTSVAGEDTSAPARGLGGLG